MKNFIKNNKAIVIAVSIFLIVILSLGIIFLVKNNTKNNNIEIYEEPQVGQEEIITPVEPEKTETLMDKVKELNKTYSEAIGWLKVSNTNIDGAVFKSVNNTRYERYNRDNVYDSRGEYFLDYANNQGNIGNEKMNYIIYGHNTLKEGDLFTDLYKYEDENFYKENKIIEFSTTNANYKWEVFSVYYISTDYTVPTFFYYWDVEFKNDTEYQEYINKAKSHSKYNTGVEVTTEDSILTLSTCGNDQATNGETENRFVVQAKLIKE